MYTLKRWCDVRLATLSVYNIKDVFRFGLMISEIAIIGLGLIFVYQKINKKIIDSFSIITPGARLSPLFVFLSSASGGV